MEVSTKKKNHTAKRVLSYTRLQLHLSLRSDKHQKKSSIAISWILKIVVLIAILGFVFLFTRSLVRQTDKITGKNVCILFVTVAQLFILIYSIAVQSKRLYKPSDLSVISTMPLSPFQRYLGEIIAIYTKIAIYTLVIFWSTLLIFGWGCEYSINPDGKIMSAGFVFSSLLGSILLPLLPFAISLVISVPFMLLGSVLRDRNIVKLVLFIVLAIGFMIAYGFFLKFLTDVLYKSQSTAILFKNIAAFLNSMNQQYNPCYNFSEICLANNIGRNLGIGLAITIGLMAIGLAITIPLYKKFTSKGMAESVAKTTKSKLTKVKPFKAIFLKEIKQILRTPNYAYFFLGVAVAMPVLTYLITDLVKKLGEETMGTASFFGFSLLVIMLVVSLIGSYSANVISKEGKEFYITKITPLTYRKQMFAKLLVNFMVSCISLILCWVVIGAMSLNISDGGRLTVGGWFLQLGIALLFLIGITFNGANIELVRPKVNTFGSETNESNIVIQLVISMAITAIFSVIAIAVTNIYTKVALWIQLGVLLLAIIYCLVNFLVWFKTCDKKYNRIEIK